MLEKWLRQEIMIDGNCFFYRWTGYKREPIKPVMVLMHGFSDNGLCWQPMAEELEEAFDILLPDARGHGLSARVKPGEQFDAAADLANLLRALELPPVILGGHSMGAGVATNVAAQYPAMVRALILEDPPWFLPQPVEDGEAQAVNPMHEFVQSLQGKTLEQLMKQYRIEHPTWSEIILQRWCEGKQQLDPNFLSTRGLGWVDWREKIKAITCPVLLITAEVEKGGLVSAKTAELAASLNPGLQIAHISGAGHHVRFENPGEYMQVVHTFLQELS